MGPDVEGLPTFQDRLQVEIDEVNGRLGKLHNFVGSMPFDALSRPHRYFLKKQLAVMEEYSDILLTRMALLNIKESK